MKTINKAFVTYGEGDDLDVVAKIFGKPKRRVQNIREGRHTLTIIATDREKSCCGKPGIFWVYLEDENGDKMWHKFVLHKDGVRALVMFCKILGVQLNEGEIPPSWKLTGKTFSAEVVATEYGDNHLVNWRPANENRE
ncbi:TPA: hypothetical protein DDW35_10290 [Candidatus Sumerlaeota bacterium]|jgi:hypothetical protein|nr:hypothetical protein [Candidatus Sumerlaeota bacterium]